MNKKITILLGLIVMVFCFIIKADLSQAAGPTEVVSNITIPTVWSKENSPYIIRTRIFVEAELTIEPGTIIKFDYYGDASLNIYNKLNAIGTADDRIIFTSIRDDSVGGDTNNDGEATQPNKGDWWWIHFYGNTQSTMEYCAVLYGSPSGVVMGAITINSNDKLIIRNCEIKYSDYIGILIHGSQPTIENNIITNNNIGIFAWGNKMPTITNNSIFDNNLGAGAMFMSSLDATNNWWGHDSGPYHTSLNPQGQGDRVGDGVMFDPWIGKEGKEPVIIVPGIMGSYLYTQDGEQIWPAIDNVILDPWDTHLNKMILPYNGEATGNNILVPNDIFRKILFKDFWQGLIDELESNGYEEGENLFVFPYDWRWDLNLVAGISPITNIQSMAEKVAQVKIETGADKVNIIAHSIGGLIAKKYIKDYGSENVNKFIDIATPHLGAPKAFKILMYGDNLGFEVLKIFNLNEQKVFEISQNFPSIYQLLPSSNYFNPVNNDYAYYIYDMHDLDNNDVAGRLDYDQSIEFMINTGRNEYLLGFNNSLHSEIDNYSPIEDSITTFNIVGCSQPTIGQFIVMNKDKSGKYEYGLKYINGDETVPLRSADSLTAETTYYVNDSKHSYLPSAQGVKQLIVAILKNKEEEFDFSNHTNLMPDSSSCSFSGTQISFHSPIELHVYDENNNHLGPDENNDIEMAIAGAQYDIIEDNKFVFLPTGQHYTIIGQATDAGFFNTRIQTINNNQYEQTVYYNKVPLNSADTNVQFIIQDNQEDYSMQIDQDDDQIFEQVIEPSSILNQEETEDLVKPETEIIVTGEQTIDNKYINSVLIELIGEDNQHGSGILKTEYSLDNGGSWQIYEEPFVLDQAGEQTILYSSTDRAGNIESIKELNIEIKIIDIENVILEIEMFFEQGMITKKVVKDQLIKKLNWIQEYIKRYGKREVRREKIFDHILEKCMEKKSEDWCEEKLGSKFDKIDYKLDQVHQKIVKKQYQVILKLLEFYNKKQWINNQVYVIIKEDIEYLINNL